MTPQQLVRARTIAANLKGVLEDVRHYFVDAAKFSLDGRGRAEASTNAALVSQHIDNASELVALIQCIAAEPAQHGAPRLIGDAQWVNDVLDAFGRTMGLRPGGGDSAKRMRDDAERQKGKALHHDLAVRYAGQRLQAHAAAKAAQVELERTLAANRKPKRKAVGAFRNWQP